MSRVPFAVLLLRSSLVMCMEGEGGVSAKGKSLKHVCSSVSVWRRLNQVIENKWSIFQLILFCRVYYGGRVGSHLWMSRNGTFGIHLRDETHISRAEALNAWMKTTTIDVQLEWENRHWNAAQLVSFYSTWENAQITFHTHDRSIFFPWNGWKNCILINFLKKLKLFLKSMWHDRSIILAWFSSFVQQRKKKSCSQLSADNVNV